MKTTAHQLRAIAVEAKRDPRSVRDFLSGRPVRSTTAASITEAIDRLGLDHHEPSTDPPLSAA